MMNINLDELSLAELKQLRSEVDEAIKSFEARNLAKARKEFEARAKELGITLDMVVGVKPDQKKKKSAAKPKFRNLQDPEVTWSGRGRRPIWFVEALEAGVAEEEMKI